MPAEWELVLDLGDDEDPDERVCYYYFVNCSNRSLFWLHKFDVTPFLDGLEVIKSKRRIRESGSRTPSTIPLSDPQPQNKHWRAIIGKLPRETSVT